MAEHGTRSAGLEMLRRRLGGQLGFTTFRAGCVRVARVSRLCGAAAALVGLMSCAGSTRLAFTGDPSVEESSRLGQARYRPQVCEGLDLTPENSQLTVDALKRHLDGKGLSYKVRVERPDLHLVDVVVQGTTVELRVATLEDRAAAGRHLHLALLEHGGGFWGVHRGNLAVLGPPGSVNDVLAFGASTGLACFGVLTVAGRDDTFVVPGGYFEL
jgi:hypothetical protein